MTFRFFKLFLWKSCGIHTVFIINVIIDIAKKYVTKMTKRKNYFIFESNWCIHYWSHMIVGILPVKWNSNNSRNGLNISKHNVFTSEIYFSSLVRKKYIILFFPHNEGTVRFNFRFLVQCWYFAISLWVVTILKFLIGGSAEAYKIFSTEKYLSIIEPFSKQT